MGNSFEKIAQQGIRVHGLEYVQPGDTVEAVRNVQRVISKGTRVRVAQLIIERATQGEGHIKKLTFEDIKGEFNPQRFIKINE